MFLISGDEAPSLKDLFYLGTEFFSSNTEK